MCCGRPTGQLFLRLDRLVVASGNHTDPAYRDYGVETLEVERLYGVGRMIWVAGTM